MNPPKNCPLKKRRFQPAFVWVLGRGEKERWLQQQWWYTVNIQCIYIYPIYPNILWWSNDDIPSFMAINIDQLTSINNRESVGTIPQSSSSKMGEFRRSHFGYGSCWIMLDAGCWFLQNVSWHSGFSQLPCWRNPISSPFLEPASMQYGPLHCANSCRALDRKPPPHVLHYPLVI
jgi:hypothetical protein